MHDREFRMMKDRPKNVGWSATPADGILAAHCRPNGKLGTSVERAAFGQNTSLLMAEEVTGPIEQFGHIVARPSAASLVA
jgi:hypothetical protein